MMNEVYRFFGTDPALAWTLTLALCFTLAAFVIVARSSYQARRQAREDQEFRETMRAMLASSESITWPKPVKKTDQPWQQKRSA